MGRQNTSETWPRKCGLAAEWGPPHFEGKVHTFHDANFPMWVVTMDRLRVPQHFLISHLVIFFMRSITKDEVHRNKAHVLQMKGQIRVEFCNSSKNITRLQECASDMKCALYMVAGILNCLLLENGTDRLSRKIGNQTTPRNIPEERRFQQHRGVRPKSRKNLHSYFSPCRHLITVTDCQYGRFPWEVNILSLKRHLGPSVSTVETRSWRPLFVRNFGYNVIHSVVPTNSQ
jgi:hypothetical protein